MHNLHSQHFTVSSDLNLLEYVVHDHLLTLLCGYSQGKVDVVSISG